MAFDAFTSQVVFGSFDEEHNQNLTQVQKELFKMASEIGPLWFSASVVFFCSSMQQKTISISEFLASL